MIDLQVWAPQQTPLYLKSTVGIPYRSLLFPLALQNAGLFEAVVASAQTFHDVQSQSAVRPSAQAFQYYGNAVQILPGISGYANGKPDDTALIALVFLMGMDVGT